MTAADGFTWDLHDGSEIKFCRLDGAGQDRWLCYRESSSGGSIGVIVDETSLAAAELAANQWLLWVGLRRAQGRRGMIPAALSGAHFVAIRGKLPVCKGWPDIRLSLKDAERRVTAGGNIAFRLGPASGDIVDCDLDCPEALALADLYLPTTGAEFGRPSKPRSHRLYRAPGAVFASFADPTDGTMLLELRADGRDGGAHLTTIPPSVTSGERREWCNAVVEPADADAAVLARRMAWLAIGCLTMRHVGEHAARRPGPDLPSLLWEAEPKLGRAAHHWLGELAPDEVRSPKRRRDYTASEARIDEIAAAIPNNCSWEEWNRVGMTLFAASNGSEIGFLAFDDFSARCPGKYNPHAVLERWNNYRRSPPSRLGIGTLIYLARGRVA